MNINFIFINIDERYGDEYEVTIEDYKELNPTGIFEYMVNGINEFINDEWVLIATEK